MLGQVLKVGPQPTDCSKHRCRVCPILARLETVLRPRLTGLLGLGVHWSHDLPALLTSPYQLSSIPSPTLPIYVLGIGNICLQEISFILLRLQLIQWVAKNRPFQPRKAQGALSRETWTMWLDVPHSFDIRS